MSDTWVTVSGNVGALLARDLPAGGRFVQLRVASTPRRLVEGQWVDGVTAWHTVKAWRVLAEQVATTVNVGDPVLVYGRLVAEEWTRSDGTQASENVLVATAIGLDLSRGGARVRPPVQPAEQEDERADSHGVPTDEANSGPHAA